MMQGTGPYVRIQPKEEMELNHWGFISRYQDKRIHQQLVELAELSFCVVYRVNGRPPTEAQFYSFYWWELMQIKLYLNDIVGGMNYLPSSLYGYFAQLLAKYVIKMDGQQISNRSCN